MKNFALLGLAGYVAPRHLKAIKDTENQLIVALDKHDSVGIIDSYFPDADFFTEPERFERYIYKYQHKKWVSPIDFFSICTPNYLHDAHIRMALRNNSDAICEKPVVLNPWNIDFLAELERETNRRVYTILQLRYHPAVVKLKEKIQREKTDKIHDVVLTYITGRGKWYNYSWKGDEEKSGGLVTNIGVHFFDMLHHIFGRLIAQKLHYRTSNWCAGYLLFKRAQVRWFLSTDTQYLPKEAKTLGKSSYRSILIDDKELDLTDGFTDLHTLSYEHILMGNGFGLSDAKPSIEIVHSIRHSEAVPKIDMSDMHPLVRLAKKK